MGNAVSVKEQAHRYAIVAAVKKGPVRDTLHKLRQNVEIRLREQHGQPPRVAAEQRGGGSQGPLSLLTVQRLVIPRRILLHAPILSRSSLPN